MYLSTDHTSNQDRSERAELDARAKARAEEGKRRERVTTLAADLRSSETLERLLRRDAAGSMRLSQPGARQAAGLGAELRALLGGEASAECDAQAATRGTDERAAQTSPQAVPRSAPPAAEQPPNDESASTEQAPGERTEHSRQPRPNASDDEQRQTSLPEARPVECQPRAEQPGHWDAPPTTGSSSGSAKPSVVRARGLTAEVIDAIVGNGQLDQTRAGELRLRVDFDLGPQLGQGRGQNSPFSMEVIAKGERSVALVFRGRGVPFRGEEIDGVVERLAARGIRVVESVVELG